MSFGAIFVGVEQEIIYYNQNDKLPGTLSSASLVVNIPSEIKTLSESKEKYDVHPNAFILQNMLERNMERKMERIILLVPTIPHVICTVIWHITRNHKGLSMTVER
eukprot:690580_1